LTDLRWEDGRCALRGSSEIFASQICQLRSGLSVPH
jgi:hypothetical protein